MPEPEDCLSVTLPPSLCTGEFSIVCRHLASALGQRLHSKQGTDAHKLATIAASNGAIVEMPIAPAAFDARALRVHELIIQGRTLRLLAAQMPQLNSRQMHCRIDTDLLTPIHWMLTLQEERVDLHRDRFGLVEGQRSIREKLGVLSEPFFENLVELLRLLLDCPKLALYPNGATWAVAVSSDIDVLEDDHLGGVLSFLDTYGVDRPTFMICPAIGSEKTIRDPQYDITDESARKLLAPLITANAEIGLHGSYLAHDRRGLLTAQKERLENWCNRPVTGHRAHFYRFAYPRSWMRQMQAGLTYDSSLGYPDLPGLRSGCASPTIFFDPENQPTNFTIFPTTLLDQHFFWPESWDDDRFVAYASELLNRAASLGCALNLDWHSYTWTAGFPGWWERLSWLLREARRRGAYIGGIGAVVDSHRRRWRELAILPEPSETTFQFAPDARYYDQPALWGKSPDPYQVQVQADVQDMLPPGVRSVLDLGCGDGFVTNSIPPSIHAVGMDISPEALRYLHRPGVVGSGDALPFADGAFDLVMANDVLEHLADPQREKVLAEMCRVAKSYILFASPHDEQLEANIAKCADCGARYHIHWHHQAFRGEELPPRMGPNFKLLETRYSGDVTLSPPDPLVALRHELGMYRSWSDAVCPKCGSHRHIGGPQDTVLARLLAARRCELWYGDLSSLSRSSNRSEIIALYGRKPAEISSPRSLQVVRSDLREVDFTNPLQEVTEFTTGSFWARYRVPAGIVRSAEGLSRIGAEFAAPAVEIRLPLTPRKLDRILIEAASTLDSGEISVFSIDGVYLRQTSVGRAQFGPDVKRCEFTVHEPWRADAFGAGLLVNISEGLTLRKLSYVPADRSDAIVDFLELQPGHNVVAKVDDGVRVSWGLKVDSKGHVPAPHLALAARPPTPDPDSLQMAVDMLHGGEEVLAALQADRQRLSALADEREHLRDSAERANARLEARCSHLERRQHRLRSLRDYHWQELQRRRGIKGGAREIVRTARDRVRGPVPRPRQLRISPPWAHVPRRLMTPPGALRVLVLSHMFPHPDQPSSGTFVHEQVKALRVEGGVDARVLAGRPFWMTTRHPLRLWQGNANWRRHHDEARWYLYDGIPVQYLPYRIFGPWLTHGWSYARTMLRSIDQLYREFPFDIIHAHTGYMDGSAGRKIAQRLNKPLIVTEHTGPFSMLMKNPIIRRRTLRSLSAASRVIAVSRAQQAAIAQYWSPKRPDQMVVVPNLVDTLQFHPPQEWHPDSTAPRIVFVGGFVPIKALPVLLDAFVTLRQRLPGATLTLVGGGENRAQEDELQSGIARRSLNDSARVLGHQNRSEIARLMREECDILVLCSHSETFGCVLIEALASGKPVVATRCGGPEDIVTDESLGRLCATNDPRALADALLDIASRLPSLDSARIRDYAVSRFSQSATATTIVNLYKTVLGERSMARHS